ncbi:hypothetical protein ABH992_003292 [Bradyrhizobium yuanmingense]|uniref:Uncharacterized protein n=1 Tax=Bradyrhizobium yuanmingense TaxID=108015 RepID=A0ABV4GG14_9BRAD
MLGQLGQRPIALDGGKRHLRLESRAVVPARSSVHGLSCSRQSSPLSGRNSTYRPVQICGAGSEVSLERRDLIEAKQRFARAIADLEVRWANFTAKFSSSHENLRMRFDGDQRQVLDRKL